MGGNKTADADEEKGQRLKAALNRGLHRVGHSVPARFSAAQASLGTITQVPMHEVQPTKGCAPHRTACVCHYARAALPNHHRVLRVRHALKHAQLRARAEQGCKSIAAVASTHVLQPLPCTVRTQACILYTGTRAHGLQSEVCGLNVLSSTTENTRRVHVCLLVCMHAHMQPNHAYCMAAVVVCQHVYIPSGRVCLLSVGRHSAGTGPMPRPKSTPSRHRAATSEATGPGHAAVASMPASMRMVACMVAAFFAALATLCNTTWPVSYVSCAVWLKPYCKNIDKLDTPHASPLAQVCMCGEARRLTYKTWPMPR